MEAYEVALGRYFNVTEETTPDHKYVVFETPGYMDLGSLALVGVNAKPNSTNPIGIFGTGLKIAVAVLTRLDAELSIYIGRDHYVIEPREVNFRGEKVEMLRLRNTSRRMFGGSASSVDLPFPARYGHHWEPWMVFRELESNTRDEAGITYQLDKDPGVCFAEATRIVVKHPDFYEAYVERDSIFMPEAAREGSGIQVVPRESNHLYRRGVRCFTTNKPCLFTYNYLSGLNLTEDRSLSNEFYARYYLGRWLQASDDEWKIEKVLTCGDKYWEHGVAFDETIAPSAAFHKVAMKYLRKLPPSFHTYYARYDPRVTVSTFSINKAHPGPWRLVGDRVIDKNGSDVFAAPYGYAGKWEMAARAIMRAGGFAGKEEATAVEEAATASDDTAF